MKLWGCTSLTHVGLSMPFQSCNTYGLDIPAIKCGRFQHHQWLVCFQPALNPNQKIYSSQNKIFQHHLDFSTIFWYILIIHCYWTKRRRIFSRPPGKGKVWRQYHKFFCIAWIRLDFFVHWVHVLSRSWWHGFAPNSPNGTSNTSWYYI